MSHDVQSTLLAVLKWELAVPEVSREGEHALTFRWFGMDYLVNCQSSNWLHLGVVLHGADVHDGNPSNELDLSHVPPHELTAKIDHLNLVLPSLRFTIGDVLNLRIEWSAFAFGSVLGPDVEDPDPLPEGFETRSLEAADVATMVETPMGYLNLGTLCAFQAFGRLPQRRIRGFPMAAGRMYPDVLGLARAALVRNGFTFTQSADPVPSLHFIDHAGAVFQLLVSDGSVGAYVLQMKFFEFRVFRPDASPANVIDGKITRDLLETCGAVASDSLGMKAYGSIEHACVVLSANGVLPLDVSDDVARLLPFLTGTLAGFADTVFGEAGVGILTYDQAKDRFAGALPSTA